MRVEELELTADYLAKVAEQKKTESERKDCGCGRRQSPDASTSVSKNGSSRNSRRTTRLLSPPAIEATVSQADQG